ncbi:MAG: hypothetical protein N2D54_03785 [Chloroflexota bacterium]
MLKRTATLFTAIVIFLSNVGMGGLALARPAPAPLMIPGDGNWGGFSSGVDDTVRAVAVDGQGNMYVGGDFANAGGSSAAYIAMWNGSIWSTLGSGMDNIVRALAVDSQGNLYAGGDFNDAGGVAAAHIAMWNGSIWSTLGTGIDIQVNVLTVDSQDNLFVGGNFTEAGGVPSYNVAMWDGGNWHTLEGPDGIGIFGTAVYSLAVDSQDHLYVGGSFAVAGGITAINVTKWDGSNWLALKTASGNGTNAAVEDLAVDSQDNLFLIGSFSQAGGVTVNKIAKWDGNDFTALSGPSGDGLGNSGDTVAVDSNDHVIAGGSFTNAGGTAVNAIGRWDGTQWNTISGPSSAGVSGGTVYVYEVEIDGQDNIFAGGNFTSAGGAAALNIAKFDTSNIFIDGFESGDTSAWGAVKGISIAEISAAGYCTGMCVSDFKPIDKSYDLAVTISNKLARYLANTRPIGTSRYRARFYIDPRGLTMGNLNKIKLFQGRQGKKQPFFLEVRSKGTKFQIRGGARHDGGKLKFTNWHLLPKTPVAVEIDWKAAPSNALHNGYLKLWVNGNLKQKIGKMNNDTLKIKGERLGITQKIPKAFKITGSFHLDAFVSNDTYYIGK